MRVLLAIMTSYEAEFELKKETKTLEQQIKSVQLDLSEASNLEDVYIFLCGRFSKKFGNRKI